MRGPILRLYDLEGDPGELRDLSRARPELRDRLAATLDAWRQATGEAAAGGADGVDAPGDGSDQVPDDLRRQLESLGYVGGGTGCGRLLVVVVRVVI